MTFNQACQYLSYVFIVANIALGSFVAGLPAGYPLPVWVIPTAAAVNALAHALPSDGLRVPSVPVIKALLVISMGIALTLAACANSNPTLTACGAYDSALFTVAGLRHEGKLSVAQIAAVDQARGLVNPICMQASPPTDAASLATVQSAADALAAAAAGVK